MVYFSKVIQPQGMKYELQYELQTNTLSTFADILNT